MGQRRKIALVPPGEVPSDRPKGPRRGRPPAEPADRGAWLRRELREIRVLLERCERSPDSDEPPDLPAYLSPQYRLRAGKLRNELDAWEAAQSAAAQAEQGPAVPTDPEELEAELIVTLAGLPRDVLERIYLAATAR